MIITYTLDYIGANENGLIIDLLQMALWLPSTGKFYLPPAQPTPRVLATDEYVTGTNIFFYAGSERLLTVGHPYFPVVDADDKVTVPKVSANQYRAFRVLLPDPNKFALIDQDIYDPSSERLVWKLRGLEIGRGGPIGVGTTGHPLYNKFVDTENPSVYTVQTDDDRQNVSFDPKQSQMFIVGCEPALGQHWDKAEACANPAPKKGDCYPIQLVNSVIQDGDMGDIGFGAFNFNSLQEDHASAPLDVVKSISKYPDFMKMSKDVYGDRAFFYGRREQMYIRHMFVRAGNSGDAIPGAVEHNNGYYINSDQAQEGPRKTLGPYTYFGMPSGSLASSESQLFNRPYWLQRAQGTNNGVLWGNQIFVTVFDNTHAGNFTISVYAKEENDPPTTYKAGDFKQYSRHVEEYELEFILQLCKVPLSADVLSHLHVMNPTILENWNLAFVPPAPTGIEDSYRFLSSLATKCPDQTPAKDKDDPYKDYIFWVVDLTEKLSSELSQFSLGRRFLFQTGLVNGAGGFKRPRSSSTSRRSTTRVKRRRISKS